MRLRRHRPELALTAAERALLLAGLSELRAAHADDAAAQKTIRGLVQKLGGDTDAVLFGAYDDSNATGSEAPVVDDWIAQAFWPKPPAEDKAPSEPAAPASDAADELPPAISWSPNAKGGVSPVPEYPADETDEG